MARPERQGRRAPSRSEVVGHQNQPTLFLLIAERETQMQLRRIFAIGFRCFSNDASLDMWT